MTWRVLMPSATPGLMVGVNQVIMLSLNMVIIASMIGAGGLGFDVLASLRRQAIGDGLEAGIAITLIAIVLDRLSQAWSAQAPKQHVESSKKFYSRHKNFVIALIVLATTTLIGFVVPFFAQWPEQFEITTGQIWNDLVKWININFFDQLEAVKVFILLNYSKTNQAISTEPPMAGRSSAACLGWLSTWWTQVGSVGCFSCGIYPDHRAMDKSDDHRLPVRHLRRHRDHDWNYGGSLHLFLSQNEKFCTGFHRYAANTAKFRLSPACGDAVPRR